MKFSDIIVIILFVLTIIIISWYIFGKSPTFEQSLLILILTITFTNSLSIKEIKTKLTNLENKFNSLASDFKEHIKHK